MLILLRISSLFQWLNSRQVVQKPGLKFSVLDVKNRQGNDFFTNLLKNMFSFILNTHLNTRFGFFILMLRSAMSLQQFLSVECSDTVITFIPANPSVDTPVDLQLIGACKAFVTKLTLKWHYAGMLPHVNFQLALSFVFIPTHFTAERSFVAMPEQMVFHSYFCWKLFWTHWTVEKFFFSFEF